MLFQFITAACGMAAMAGIMKGLAAKTAKTIGNFWVYMVKSTDRILMPLSLLVGILLIINGTPMSFDGKQTITTLEGNEQVISQGPTAAIVPIKQLGTNGGGYFGDQLLASAREPQRLYQYARMLVDSDHSDGHGVAFRILYPT